MAGFRVDAIRFRPTDLVVGGEGAWCGSRVVLQADAHQDRAFHPSREVLGIDVTECRARQFPRVLGISAQPVPDDHPRPGCHFETFHGVDHERDIRSAQCNALVECCGAE